MKKLNDTRCSRTALQAALQSIVNSRFFAGGLIDGLSREKNLQICLSGAVNGMSFAFSRLSIAAIHNYQLSIIFPLNEQKTDEKQKNATALFLFFIHTNTGPRIGQKVNRGFLAVALRKSGIDFLNDLWHRLPNLRASLRRLYPCCSLGWRAGESEVLHDAL